MIRLKTSVLMISLALLLSMTGIAAAEEIQTCPKGFDGGPGMMGHGPGPMGPLGRLADELSLTDEQKAEIRAIVAEEMPAARQRIEERVSGVLTAEQQTALETLKEERPGMTRKGKGPGKGRGMRGPGGPGEPGEPGARLERMAEALELTDDQKTAIGEIFAEAAPEKRADIREKIKNVLTPEQQEKMETRHQERQERMAQRHNR